MASDVNTTPTATARIERYRQAEREYWDHYGLEPKEQLVDLVSPAVRLRVVEIGSGEPVLLVPGAGGTGPYWGPLVREMQSFRCLMLDRPGWGLSSPINYENYAFKTLIADILKGTLDSLGIDRAHGAGASIGDVWVLRLAQLHPDRAGKIVLLGGGPVLAEAQVPPPIKLISSPLGAIIVRLPQRPGMMRSQLRRTGHGESLDAGRFDHYIAWRVAFDRNTDSMRNERDMVKALVNRRGWRPGLTFDDAELAAIQQPTLQVYGTADPAASPDIVKRIVDLLPNTELIQVDGGGHFPWFDDPVMVGSSVSAFLRG